jgi:hypothetical protein
MGMGLGVGDAPVHEPGIEIIVGLEPQPRREEALADEADLVDLFRLSASDRYLRIPAGWSRRKPIVMVVAAHIAVGFAGEAMPLRQRLGLCVDHGTNLGRSVFAYLDRGASRGHDATLSTEHNVGPRMLTAG